MPLARVKRLLVSRIPIMARTYFAVIIKKPKYQGPMKDELASQAGTGHIFK